MTKDFNRKMYLDFLVRRWCRTMPNYFLVLVLLILSYSLMGKLPGYSLAPYFVFSQNLFSPHPGFFPEAWSLAVEEWFYLLVPIPLYIATKFSKVDRKKLIVCLIFLVIIATTAFRIYKAYEYDYASIRAWDLHLRKQVFTRLDGLMYGVAGAYFSLFHSENWKKYSKPLLCFGLILIIFDKILHTNIAYLNYLNITIVSLATLCLLPYLSGWQRNEDVVTRIVTFTSVISYSMYLLNLTFVQSVLIPVVELQCSNCLTPSLVTYALYWVVTLACSTLLYYCFERHATKIRDMISYSEKPTNTDTREQTVL